MIKGLIRGAAANAVLSNLLMVGIILAGLASLFSITVKNFPEIDLGAVQITVAYPGATPQEIADTILIPIEGRVRTIDGIRRITAEARTGVATVTAALERNADPREVMDDIRSAIGEITVFPSGSETPILTEVEAPELAIQYILAGDVPEADLRELAFAIRNELLALPNVSSVDLSGMPPAQIDILVSQRTLDAYGLSLRDLAGRIGNQSLDLSGGTLLSDQERVQLRTEGLAETGAEYARLPILSSESGAILTLADIAEVRDGPADTGVIARLNGQPSIFLTVNREGDQQILDLVETTRAYVTDRVRPRLPDTIQLVEWRDEAQLLTGRISALSENAMIGAVLILVLLAVTLEARVAFWVLVGITTAFVGSFTLMPVFGVTINQLSLFGFILALGVVVDDAIVVGENIFSKRAGRSDPLKAAQDGATGVAAPVIFAVGTTMCAFFPLLMLPGTSGAFIAPVAAVVILVLALSLVDSLFILPHHLAKVSMRPPERGSPIAVLAGVRGIVGGSLDAFANTVVRRVARFVIAQPLFVILTSFGLFMGSLATLSSGAVKFVFFPEIEGDYVVANIELPEGTSEVETLLRADAVAAAAERAAARIAVEQALAPEDVLTGVSVAIGFAVAAGDPSGAGQGSTDRASVEVRILGADVRTFGAGQFEAYWREEAADVPGIVQLSFSSSVVPIGADIDLRISARFEDTRLLATARIREALAERPGVLSIRDSETTTAQEAIFVTSETARSLGITVNDIARELRSAVFGERVRLLQRNEEDVDVRVRLPDDERVDLDDLTSYRIRVGGTFVPLSTLGEFSVANAPSTVTRVNLREVVTLLADVDEAFTSGGAEIQYLLTEVLPEIQELYPDVTVELAGEAEEQDDFGPALAVDFGLALFAILALLSLALSSYGQPIMILLTIPFGFMGALLGHWTLGLDLTLLSIFGVVGLSGIVINGALLLLATYNRLRAEGQAPRDAIEDAVVSRFRPIFLTTLTTVLGVTPLVLETSIQAQFLIPTAVSLSGGIMVGSLFVLCLVPAYASLFAPRTKPIHAFTQV